MIEQGGQLLPPYRPALPPAADYSLQTHESEGKMVDIGYEGLQVRESGWKTETDEHGDEVPIYEKNASGAIVIIDGKAQRLRAQPLDTQLNDIFTSVLALEKDWKLSDRIDAGQGMVVTRRPYRKVHWKNMKSRPPGSWWPPKNR